MLRDYYECALEVIKNRGRMKCTEWNISWTAKDGQECGIRMAPNTRLFTGQISQRFLQGVLAIDSEKTGDVTVALTGGFVFHASFMSDERRRNLIAPAPHSRSLKSSLKGKDL